MKILITNIWMNDFSGSEIVTLEIAKYFKAKGNDVSIETSQISPLLRSYCALNDFSVFVPGEITSEVYFDLVWIHHFFLPLRFFANDKKYLSNARFIFHHMSPFEPFESSPFPEMEEKISSRILVNSAETREAITKLGLKSENVLIFGNPAPEEFRKSRRERSRLENLLFVSNHPPLEVKELISDLSRDGFGIRHIGSDSEISEKKLVDSNDLNWADAVISIGKTVQYALLSKVPVFVYDHFGGDEWIDDIDKLNQFSATNFSGRSKRIKHDKESLRLKIFSGFSDSLNFVSSLTEDDLQKFDLEYQMQALTDYLKMSHSSPFHKLDEKDWLRWENHVEILFRASTIAKLSASNSMRDSAVQERDSAVQERDSAVQERDSAVQERDSAVQERDSAVQERDSAVQERDSAVQERDSAVQERDSVYMSRIWRFFYLYRSFRGFFEGKF
jgi:hypothetical protein